MGGSIYHILDFIPAVDREEMSVGGEELAWQLVHKGRFRIDAGTNKINFARFYVPELGASIMFSYRELYDQVLLKNTQNTIVGYLSAKYKGRSLQEKTAEYIKILRNELAKYQVIPYEEEMKLARLVVQAAHPVVIMLILAEGTEVFVSHSYNIGDMLDIGNWRSSGENSGMQSTDGRETAVFISCGGNPLADNPEEVSFYGDGWAAMARLLVIGGQEIGHYSDIRRDSFGRQVGRYSANLSATRATEVARIGRLNDIERDKNLLLILAQLGFNNLLQLEINLKFFRLHKRGGFTHFFTWLKIQLFTPIIKHRIKSTQLGFLLKFFKEKYPAITIKAMINDMLFNLAPQADVYRNQNKTIEEAIACVEALARVPQQANKWGRDVTKFLMQDLYQLYYKQVIPGCIEAYQVISGKTYQYDPRPMPKSLVYRVKKLFRKKIKVIRDVDL